jgi:hypothetical protein
MVLRHAIGLVLLAVLVWRIAVYWDPFLRDWAGWKNLRRKKRRRRLSGKWYKKAKPFAGLTRKPVCALCAHGESEVGQAPSEGPPPRIEYERQAKSDPHDSLKVTHLDRLCHNSDRRKVALLTIEK